MKIFWFLFIFIVGCSSNYHQTPKVQISKYINPVKTRQLTETIYIDQNFNEREIKLINLAKSKWEQNTNNIINFNLIYNYKYDDNSDDSFKKILIKLKTTDKFYQLLKNKKDEDFISGDFRGTSNNEYLVITRDLIESEFELYINILQLYGLSIDLSYMTKTEGIMKKGNININCITENDINLFCATFLCNPKELSFCAIKQVEEDPILEKF